MKSDTKATTVAVVGSGMAGLATANLLQRDPRRRYRVTVLEKKNELSLNSESVVISPPGEKVVWADVPMRAIAGGFYQNLIHMYDYLGIRFHQQQFLFTFAKLPYTAPYMIHTSNFHQVPPKPLECGFAPWLAEAAYVVLCYLWFSICCFLVEPYADTETSNSENLDQYLRRIHLPQYYANNYLLPLMAGVCTCSHQELVNFPASDFTNYKKSTHRQQHYVVEGGVQNVQDKLSKELDVRLDVCLTGILPTVKGVEVKYLESNGLETCEIFDKVVLAVSPDIVAGIFEPLKEAFKEIPTTTVKTVAHTDWAALPILNTSIAGKSQSSGATTKSANPPQNMHLRSNNGDTESVHEQSSSVIVTTNPLTPINKSKIIRSSTFTRVLRSTKSKRVINDIFRDQGTASTTNIAKGWRNGDGGVYLAGGWCWDGMVLLEGCIVSAMRVASCLDVDVPWASIAEGKRCQ